MERVQIELAMKNVGRNDPCPCGSGKKFKKCCEAKTQRKGLTASRIDPVGAPQVQKAVGLTSLFHASTLAIPKKTTPEPQPEIPAAVAQTVIQPVENSQT
jgi:hypothetical protein